MTLEFVTESLQNLINKEKFKIIKNIVQNLKSLEVNFCNALTKENVDILLEFVNQACQLGFVPDLDYEQFDISKEHFKEYQGDTVILLENLILSTKYIAQLRQDFIDKNELNSAIIQMLMLCASHDGNYDWATETSRSLSQELLKCIIKLEGKGEVFEDVPSDEEYNFYLKFAKRFLVSLLPSLLDKKWKENPSFKHVFQWYLLRIKHPHLGELLPEVLPPSLLFVDDYVTDNKILGLTCLSHIMNNVNPTELTWFGRAEVIFAAVEHLLYTREADLIPALHPCILQILKIVEGDPLKIIKYNRYDKVFEMILSDMEFEQQLVLRRVYPLYLPLFIEAMGITVVRHLKRLLEMTGSYLEVYDGPEERSRKLILLMLKSLIRTAWPRIPYHMETILKILLRFLYDLEIDRTTTPQSVKENLIHLANDCLLLLKKTNPEKFKELCYPLVEDAQHLPAVPILREVIESEDCACTLYEQTYESQV